MIVAGMAHPCFPWRHRWLSYTLQGWRRYDNLKVLFDVFGKTMDRRLAFSALDHMQHTSNSYLCYRLYSLPNGLDSVQELIVDPI